MRKKHALAEAEEIEAQAAPCRERVKELFSKYRKNRQSGPRQDVADSSVSLAVQEKFANYRPPSGNGA